MAKKSKKKAVEEPEPEPEEEEYHDEDEEEEDDNEEVAAMEEDDGEDGEEEAGEDEEDEEGEDVDAGNGKRERSKAAQLRAVIRKSRTQKAKGYRRLAMMSLTGSKRGTLQANLRATDAETLFDVPAARVTSTDSYKAVLSLNAISRMCKFVPNNLGGVSYTPEELKRRAELSQEPLTQAAAQVVRGNIEVIAHKIIVNTLLNRWDGSGKPKISAYDIHMATRNLEPQLDFSSSFPIGLIRNAQTTPEPFFIAKTKTVNGKTVKYKEPKDKNKFILNPSTIDNSNAVREKAAVTDMRKSTTKMIIEKIKARKARKGKPADEAADAPATGGEAVAPMME